MQGPAMQWLLPYGLKFLSTLKRRSSIRFLNIPISDNSSTVRKTRTHLNSRFFLVIAAMLILSMGNACIQEKSVKSINDLSMTSYVDHDVTWNALKSGGLAIFPTRVNVGKKIEAQIIENLLNKEIRRRFAGIHVVDYEEMQRFSSKSKRKKWIEMLVSHSSPHSIRGSDICLQEIADSKFY